MSLLRGHTRLALAITIGVAACVPAMAWGRSGPVNLHRRWPVAEAEGKTWIGTPGGLLRYAPADDAFKRLPLAAGDQFPAIRDLQYNDEWLWCVTDQGLDALHIRLNEWLHFDRSRGLPSDRVNALAFTDDYAWAATDSGAARFDPVIEEWEIIGRDRGLPEAKVNDVIVAAGRVWFVTDHGLAEYDSDFEKWRYHDVSDDSTVTAGRAFTFGDDVWLVSDRGLIRFSPELETRQNFFLPYLSTGALKEILLSDDAIWAVTPAGLHYYDITSQAWRDFEENAYLAGAAVTGAFAGGQEVWVLTDTGVQVWSRASKRWTELDYASGLSRTVFEAVYAGGESAFLLDQSAIDYRRTSSEKWRRWDMAGAPGGRVTTPVLRVLADVFDNQQGGGVEMGRYRLGFDGTRINLSDTRRRYFGAGGDKWSVTSASRLDLKSLLALGEGRGLAGFYNNTDYGRTLYGVHYRADNDDVLHDAAWGDMRHEPGDAPFGDKASLFGYSLWLQGGPKTERFKRSLVAVKADAGARRSETAYEHFTGQTGKTGLNIPDYAYAEYVFTLPGVPPGLRPDFLEIYLDDLYAPSNGPNTLVGHSIAGTTGDFDLLRGNDDYAYDPGIGVILDGQVLTHSLEFTLAARYAVSGAVFEEMLRAQGVSTERRNVYRIPEKTIPYSFKMAILDTLGNVVPLADFGLDADGDGLVDSQWIDCAGGFLVFPEEEPFPPEAYDPDAPRSFYHLDISLETSRPLLYLAHGDLVRGTEVVRLDGIRASAGEDYVLDYTFGSLIFVREGLVNADTRIEIEYEYYVDTENEDVAGASLALSPSDDLYVQADWLGRRPESRQAGGEGAGAHLVSLHSEAVGHLGSYDLKIKPGLAYRADSARIAATSVETLLSSARLRFQARHQRFDETYSGLSRPQSVVGEIDRRLEFHSTADLTRDLRLGGDWQRVDGRGQAGAGPQNDRTGNASLLFRRPGWPSWEMAYADIATASGDESAERRFAQTALEYQMPDGVASRLAINSLRAEARIRAGRERDTSREIHPNRGFRQGFIRLDTGISDRFQTGLFYRSNSTYEDSGGERYVLSRSQRVTMSLSHEEWRLFQISLYAENTQDDLHHPSNPLSDVYLEQHSQVTVRLAPGAVRPALSFTNFEANANLARDARGTTDDADAAWVWRILGGHVRDLPDWNTNFTCYLRNELRPGAAVTVTSTVEWNRIRKDFVAGSLGTGYWRWSENLDWSLGATSRLKAQYRLQENDLGYAHTYQSHQPAISLESRWSPEVHSIVYLDYFHTADTDGAADQARRRWHARCDLTLNKRQFLRARQIELRQSLDGARDASAGLSDRRVYTLGTSTSLDIYAVHSTILRLKADWTGTWDKRYPGMTHALRLETKVLLIF